MQKQDFFRVRPSQLEIKLGAEWSFLRKKSIEAPPEISFHNDKRCGFELFITLFMAVIGTFLGGGLTITQLTSTASLDYILLTITVLVFIWAVDQLWQGQQYLFGAIPGNRQGFWLDEKYLVHVRNKQSIHVFPRKAIGRIELTHKKIPNPQQGENDRYEIKIYPQSDASAYRYRMQPNAESLIKMFEERGLQVSYLKQS